MINKSLCKHEHTKETQAKCYKEICSNCGELIGVAIIHQAIKMNANDFMKGYALQVVITGLTVWRIRIFIGTMLFRLASVVMNCGIEFEDSDE